MAMARNRKRVNVRRKRNLFRELLSGLRAMRAHRDRRLTPRTYRIGRA